MSELNARIPCTADTRATIRDLRSDGERYEEVLQRLVREYEDKA